VGTTSDERGHRDGPGTGGLDDRLAAALGRAVDGAAPTGASRDRLLAAGRARLHRRRAAGLAGAGVAVVVGLTLSLTLPAPTTTTTPSAAPGRAARVPAGGGPAHASTQTGAAVPGPTAARNSPAGAGAGCVTVAVGRSTGGCAGNLVVATASQTFTTSSRAQAAAGGTAAPGTGTGALTLSVGQRLRVALPAGLGAWSVPSAAPGRLRRTGATVHPGRGAVVAAFVAVRAGTVVLRATAGPRCAPGAATAAGCAAGTSTWSLAVLVRPAPAPPAP